MAGALSAAVVALAGRRVDAEVAEPARFPLHQVPLVRQRIAALLAGEKAVALVCSAACGADLLALEAAGRLGLRTRIVLPFGAEAFRRVSVTDRPGDWGPVFDARLAAASAAGDVVVLDGREGDDQAYADANEAILREAAALGEPGWRRLAVVVWEGSARAGSDATAHFREQAAGRGFEARSVLTV